MTAHAARRPLRITPLGHVALWAFVPVAAVAVLPYAPGLALFIAVADLFFIAGWFRREWPLWVQERETEYRRAALDQARRQHVLRAVTR